MSLKTLLKVALALWALAAPPAALASEMVGPDVALDNGNIVVSASLVLDPEKLDDIEKGLAKEIDFYVDLFRVWRKWPDEFVLGRKITRTLKCDSVKKEYVASSLEGTALREKRFSDCPSLIRWALRIEPIRLTSTRELEPARYFVKVTAESRIKRLPSVVGYLFFFIRDKEFKVHNKSPEFTVNGYRGPGGEGR